VLLLWAKNVKMLVFGPKINKIKANGCELQNFGCYKNCLFVGRIKKIELLK